MHHQPFIAQTILPPRHHTIRLDSHLDSPKRFQEWVMMPLYRREVSLMTKQVRQLPGNQRKDREKKQNAFIAHCCLDNAVIIEEEYPKQFRGCSKTMALQNIKGVCINQLGAIILCQFFISTNYVT
jgi:hypothetical protein